MLNRFKIPGHSFPKPSGLGLRAESLGYRVQGLWFKVSGSGLGFPLTVQVFRALGSRFGTKGREFCRAKSRWP